SDEDEQRMWDALNGGLVDILSSDHAPATLAQKRAGDLWEVHFGLPGIDTTFPVMLDAALQGRIALERLTEEYAAALASLYGLDAKGRISPGADAVLALADPDARWTLTNDLVISRAGWTPYGGRQLHGRVAASILRGRVLAENGQPPSGEPTGRFV